MGIVEIYSAVIGAVFGAFFATLGGIFKELKDRRKRRKSLATVLLCELRSTDISLRGVYEAGFGIFPSGSFELFSATGHLLDVFKPGTVRLILDFSAKLNGVRDLLEGALSGRLQRDSHFNTVLPARIAGTLGLVEELKSALEAENGEYIPFIPPVMPELLEGQPGLPPLLPSPFEDIS